MERFGGVTGGIISLVLRAIDRTNFDPLDDPRILAHRLGFRFHPAAEDELAPAELYRLRDDQSFAYRWDRDEHLLGHASRLPIGHLLLIRNGLPANDEEIARITGRLALPFDGMDPDRHPFAPADFLRAELRRRQHSTSGIYPRPR